MLQEKVIILGARKGLGNEILKKWRDSHPQDQLYGTSRQPFTAEGVSTQIFDFSQAEETEKCITYCREQSPHRLFYIPGGGPYGPFVDKKWESHLWALQVTLLTPMRLIHQLLELPSLKQLVVVGSDIAEAKPDAKAASYAAAKHGLKGLVSSLRQETTKDLRLFSPGYMQTSLLPPDAEQRVAGKTVENPQKVAEIFVQWAMNTEAPWHWTFESSYGNFPSK